MKTVNKLVILGMMVVGLFGIVMTGCESTKTTDNVISVTPGSVTLTNDWATVMFSASMSGSNTTLALPLVWSVSDPARGTIRASGGLTAVYEGKNLGGNNTVTVRDQGDNEGIAIVIH